MHTRRFGAFLIGMWVMGAIFMWFVRYQADINVDRLFSNPPLQIQKEINDMGNEVARQVFRFDESLIIRRVQENWEIIQLGILGALIVSAVLTPHRSRIVVACSVLMLAFVLIQAFYLTPYMVGLARSFDFLPASAAVRERENFMSMQLKHSALTVLNTIMAVLICSRLLFDFYDFGSVVLPWSKPPKKRRRTRRGSGATSSRPAGPADANTATEPGAVPDGPSADTD